MNDKSNVLIEEFLLLIVKQMLDSVHKCTLFMNAEIMWLTVFLKLHQKYYLLWKTKKTKRSLPIAVIADNCCKVNYINNTINGIKISWDLYYV